jgi:hypothetical protein
MSRAVIVATGDLDHLPQEIQTVSNVLNAAGWKVQLCLGPDASRAGLLAAAGEGDVDLAWFGLHSGAEGFALSDGVWPPAQLGTWLRNVNACDCVLNSCYSIEHVDAIQRAADNVGVACTINPAGVDDALAWQVGVHLARAYAVTEELRSSVQWASGAGSLAYRFIPAAADVAAGGIRGGRMAMDESVGIREDLRLLMQAVQGDGRTGAPGLLPRVAALQASFDVMATEQRQWREEQREWRSDVERRLGQLERPKPVVVSERSVYVASVIIVLLLAGLLAAVMMFNGRFG